MRKTKNPMMTKSTTAPRKFPTPSAERTLPSGPVLSGICQPRGHQEIAHDGRHHLADGGADDDGHGEGQGVRLAEELDEFAEHLPSFLAPGRRGR